MKMGRPICYTMNYILEIIESCLREEAELDHFTKCIYDAIFNEVLDSNAAAFALNQLSRIYALYDTLKKDYQQSAQLMLVSPMDVTSVIQRMQRATAEIEAIRLYYSELLA